METNRSRRVKQQPSFRTAALSGVLFGLVLSVVLVLILVLFLLVASRA